MLVLILSGDLSGPCTCYFSLTSFEHLMTWVSLMHIDVYQVTPFEITSSLFQCSLLVHKCNVNLFTGSFVRICDSRFNSNFKGICLLNGVKMNVLIAVSTSLIMDSHECMSTCCQFPRARLFSKKSAVCE